MSGQRRHEAPDLGDAIVRMMRALVARAAEGDTEAVEQLARVEQLAGTAMSLGGRLAHDEAGYSYTQLGDVLGVSRQAARQRATLVPVGALRAGLSGELVHPDAHQLVPGHHRASCSSCQRAA